MIRVQAPGQVTVVELDLDEFEQQARSGRIGPRHRVCFPVVTGDRFVPARELELYRDLYTNSPIIFRQHFHLRRVPLLTLGLIASLCAIYLAWQGGQPASVSELLKKGAKSPALMVELGHWWRLLTANLLHVSGWHLGVNAFFLFNIGGASEAIFRRHDYGILLFASAIGTMALSTLANPTVSVGASGMVFGVWGGAAVFGVRHRQMLPGRYRRYFISGLIPYSIVALYFGFVMPGIDNWGHLGGLLAGSSTALFLPARLLYPRDPRAYKKALVAVAVLLALVLPSLLPADIGTLSTERFFPRAGLVAPIPSRWETLLEERQAHREAFAYHNGADVVVGVETERSERPVTLQQITTRFVEEDLAEEIENASVVGLKLSDPEPLVVGGQPAMRIHAEIATEQESSSVAYIFVARGYYRYILSLSSPTWLHQNYRQEFARIVAGVHIISPDALSVARELQGRHDAPATRVALAREMAYVGDIDQATALLDETAARWPQSGQAPLALAELANQAGEHSPEACTMALRALSTLPWSPRLLLLVFELHVGCGDVDTAERILTAGRKRFPNDLELKARRLP